MVSILKTFVAYPLVLILIGCYWPTDAGQSSLPVSAVGRNKPRVRPQQQDGSSDEFPYHLFPMASQGGGSTSRNGQSTGSLNQGGGRRNNMHGNHKNNGFGPFFGYFPNMFSGQPCPDCDCDDEHHHPDPPQVPIDRKITECFAGIDGIITEASNGTIDLSVTAPASGSVKTCDYGFVAVSPYRKVTLTCTNSNGASTFVVTSTAVEANPPTAVTRASLYKIYTSASNYLRMTITLTVGAVQVTPLTFRCSWSNIL